MINPCLAMKSLIGKILPLAGVTAFAFVVTGCSPKQESSAVSAPEVAPKTVFQWKMVTSWPKNFPGLGEGPEHFAEYVSAMSDGRLKIKVYGAGELVPALEVFDAVSQGTAEA